MFKKLEENLEEWILGVFLIGMALILLIQVIMRALLGHSLTWAEEIARYIYVWSVFLSISCTIRKKNILRVDLIESLLPKAVRMSVNIAQHIVEMILYGYLFYNSISVVQAVHASGQTSPALKIPMYIVYAIIPVGFCLATIRSMQAILFRLNVHKINGVKLVNTNEKERG